MSINALVGLNGTFEAATPPPTEVYPGYQWREQSTVHGGAWSALMYQTGSGFSRKAGGYVWTLTDLSVGRLYTLKAWVTPATSLWGGPGNANLLLTVAFTGGGSEVLAHENNVDNDAWEEVELGPFEAIASTASLTVGLQSKLIGVSDVGLWLVDDVQLLSGDMAKTVLITDAIVSDLGDISTSNGFVTDVAEVSQEPKAEILYPGLSLRPLGSGEADLETLTNRVGQAVQVYEIACYVRSSTPYSAMQNLSDDVRNSVERSSSAVLALGDANFAVRDVVVSEWTGAETSKDIDLYKASMTVTVEVTYTYNRGSV